MPTSCENVPLIPPGAADATVENSDVDFGIAEAEFVEDCGAKGVRVGDDDLARVAELVAGAEPRGNLRKERTANSGKILRE